MLIRFFRTTGAQVIVVIAIIGLLLWARPIVVPGVWNDNPAQLYQYVCGWVSGYPSTGVALAMLLVMFQAFWLVRLNARLILINNRTYLPAFFFIVITSLIPRMQILNPALLSGVFLLLSFESILYSFRSERLAYQYYSASFLLAIGSMFYLPLLFFMVYIWIGLAILRSFRWREWLFTILGFFTPILFASGLFYLFADRPFFLYGELISFFSVHSEVSVLRISEIVLLSFVAFLVVLSSQYMLQTSQSQKVLPRKAFTLLFWLFAVVIGVYVFVQPVSFELIYLLALPLSFLLTQYFANIKAVRWANLLFIVLLVLLLLTRFI